MDQFHTLLLEYSWEYNETRMGFTLWSQTWRAAKSQSSVLFAGKTIELSGHCPNTWGFYPMFHRKGWKPFGLHTNWLNRGSTTFIQGRHVNPENIKWNVIVLSVFSWLHSWRSYAPFINQFWLVGFVMLLTKTCPINKKMSPFQSISLF